MKIFIGADHRGYRLKEKIIQFLKKQGHRVVDVGTHEEGVSCDYPKISRKVALAVSKEKKSRGILACMTGIGHSIAANKVPGIRAALCYNQSAARLSRAHNNANVLIIGSKFIGSKNIMGIVVTWLKAEFKGGRHLRRVNQIKTIEKEFCHH